MVHWSTVGKVEVRYKRVLARKKTNMTILYLLFLQALASCYFQNNTTLTFVNKSSYNIDSIVVDGSRAIKLIKLPKGESRSVNVQAININKSGEGAFPFYAYFNGRQLPGYWGSHEYGELNSHDEKFFIFDNGISSIEKPLVKPKEFKLFFYNASPSSIDTILSSNNTIIKINETTPRSLEIVYDYTKIEKSKEFIIVLSGKKLQKRLDFHDFENWNYCQESLHFANDTLKPGSLGWKEPLEFIIDVEVKISPPLDSITIESNSLIKIYNFQQPKYKRIVLDFKKLKESPYMSINTGRKKYSIDLSKHNFSNIYIHQKIYTLNEDGLKCLTE